MGSCGSLGSCEVVGFTRVRHGGRWVHPGSLGSCRCALEFDGFILRGWVHSGTHCGSLCSSGVVRFTRMCPRGRWVHPGPLGSLMYALCVVGFIRGGTLVCPGCSWVYRGSWCSLGSALGFVGFIRGRWGHSDAPWGSLGSLGSSGVVGYTRVRRWVHPGSLSSIGCALGNVGFTRVSPGGRWVLLGSLGLLGCPIGVVGFIWGCWVHMSAPFVVDEHIQNRYAHAGAPWGGGWVHLGAPWVRFGLCVVDGFNRVCPGVNWVHPRSLGSLRCAQVVIGFILFRCVRSCAPMVWLGSS